jgi:hypothetical protein
VNNKLGLAEPVRKVKYFFFSYKSWHPFQNMSVPIFVVCVMFRKLVCVTGSCLKCKMSGALCEYACSRPVFCFSVCTLFRKYLVYFLHIRTLSCVHALCLVYTLMLMWIVQFYLYVYIVSCALCELSLECVLSGVLRRGQERLSKSGVMYYIDTSNMFTSTVPFINPLLY